MGPYDQLSLDQSYHTLDSLNDAITSLCISIVFVELVLWLREDSGHTQPGTRGAGQVHTVRHLYEDLLSPTIAHRYTPLSNCIYLSMIDQYVLIVSFLRDRNERVSRTLPQRWLVPDPARPRPRGIRRHGGLAAQVRVSVSDTPVHVPVDGTIAYVCYAALDTWS